MILLPVKNLSNAKQRLAAVLDQQIRTELAQQMLTDVVEAIAEFGADQVALATSDPFALDLARRFRFEVIPDESNISETDAIEKATQVCVTRGNREHPGHTRRYSAHRCR